MLSNWLKAKENTRYKPNAIFHSSALAGIYIGFIIVLCFKLGNFFTLPIHQQLI